MKITVETLVKAPLKHVWDAWNNPADIKQWNSAQEDWHTTHSTVDLREGGKFLSRMEAKDGSEGFDFEGTYTRIEPHRLIEYAFGDRTASVVFSEGADGVTVQVAFDPENEYPPEQQRDGWQAILDRFGRYAEARHRQAASA